MRAALWYGYPNNRLLPSFGELFPVVDTGGILTRAPFL